MKNLLAMTCLTALLAIRVANAVEPSYRLAGIIATERGPAIALIETPDEEQQLVREGDLLGDGQVMDISDNQVRLSFPAGEVVLQLVGTGAPEWKPPAEYNLDEFFVAETIPVTAQNLAEISQLAGEPGPDESEELGVTVMGFLNLPAGAQIMAIDDEPVGSIAEAVGKMAARINAKADQGSVFQFVVSIAAESGNKRVYVFSDESGAITQQTIPQN